MNREIEFRGKRTLDNEWLYGYLVIDKKGIYDNEEDWYYIAGNSDAYCEVIPETIGQYTGLKDKNGKKIFEGDILKKQHYQDNKPYGNEYKEVKWVKNSHYNGWSIAMGEKWEVIGTIFDKEDNNE